MADKLDEQLLGHHVDTAFTYLRAMCEFETTGPQWKFKACEEGFKVQLMFINLYSNKVGRRADRKGH